jgi:hypothetical protein
VKPSAFSGRKARLLWAWSYISFRRTESSVDQ